MSDHDEKPGDVICVRMYPPSWTTWALAVLVASIIFAAGFGLGALYGPVIAEAIATIVKEEAK